MNTMYVALYSCHMGHWETQLSGSYADGGGEVEGLTCPYTPITGYVCIRVATM